MTTTSGALKIEELIESAVQRERKRCVGLVLNAFGVNRLGGHEHTARILDALATQMELDDDSPYRETP